MYVWWVPTFIDQVLSRATNVFVQLAVKKRSKISQEISNTALHTFSQDRSIADRTMDEDDTLLARILHKLDYNEWGFEKKYELLTRTPGFCLWSSSAESENR